MLFIVKEGKDQELALRFSDVGSLVRFIEAVLV
jgi:hypothetical protein